MCACVHMFRYIDTYIYRISKSTNLRWDRKSGSRLTGRSITFSGVWVPVGPSRERPGVCFCIYIYVIYIYTDTHMFLIYIYTCIDTYICKYIFTYLYVCIHMYIYNCIYIHTYMCVYNTFSGAWALKEPSLVPPGVFVYIYLTHTHTHTHTHILDIYAYV